MSKRERKIVRAALRGRGMNIVTPDYMMREEREEPLPLWCELAEEQNRRQVEFHTEKN